MAAGVATAGWADLRTIGTAMCGTAGAPPGTDDPTTVDRGGAATERPLGSGAGPVVTGCDGATLR